MQTKTPIFHELKYNPGQYERVYWPIHKSFGAPSDTTICIKNNSMFKSNGAKIEVVSLFSGKKYPMIKYKIENEYTIYTTSIHWFAYNIAI